MLNHYQSFLKKQVKVYLLVIIAILLVPSCIPLLIKTVSYQSANTFYDQVKSRYVQELNFEFYGIIFSNSTFISGQQRTIKYTEKSGVVHIEIFDMLKMKYNNFQLEPNVYIVLDDSSFQVPFTSLTIEKQASIEEDTEDILTADSSNITVIIDYTLNQHKIISSTYHLNREQASAIVNTSELSYRYYYGPEIIDLKLSPTRLNKLKELI